MNKGFYFSFETILAFVFFIGLIALLPKIDAPAMSEIYLVQKQHDLFIAWNYLQELNSSVLISDAKTLFPTNKIELSLNNSVIFSEISEKDSAIISNKTFIYKNGAFNSIELKVLLS
ncbi:MAG: hypothetical protein Q7K42_01910 [Candidatus Diapherotrites archaeon]|nr:hypothetical protein [Candidatus Diapherotrites archaeon]